MIGLSICFCVYDMMRGGVDPKTVTKIYTASRASTSEDWERLIEQYRRAFWWQNADSAEQIFRAFLTEDKIVQPRMTEHWIPDIGPGVWVESEDQIVRSPCAD